MKWTKPNLKKYDVDELIKNITVNAASGGGCSCMTACPAWFSCQDFMFVG